MTVSVAFDEKNGSMKQSRFSEEQIVYVLPQAEGGTPIGALRRQLGVSEATFYGWKQKGAHLGVSELRRLWQVEEGNSRLKRLEVRLSLDKHMLSLKKSSALVTHRLRRGPASQTPKASP